jgi:hypothetical protein
VWLQTALDSAIPWFSAVFLQKITNFKSNSILLLKFGQNELKKGTLKIQKSKIAILVLNQSPISAVFQIVRFLGTKKNRTNFGI